MKNWTTKEFVERSKEWDLEDDAGAAVFSDHLIEVGQIRWANMLRWVVLCRWTPNFRGWVNVLHGDYYTDGFAWDNWEKYAAEHGWPRIPDDA